MKFVHCLTIGVLLLSLFACKPRVEGGSTPKNQLSSETFVGSWETQSVTILLKGKDGKDNNEVNLYPVEGSTANTKPVTHIHGNGEYQEEVYDGEGKLSSSRKGTWHYHQDTLFVRMDVPENSGMKFGVRKKGDKLTLTNLVDWNANGKKEEEMRIELKAR